MEDLLGQSTTESVVDKLRGSSKNKKLMAQFDELFSKSQKDRQPFERVWWTNMAFYFGRHYARWSTTSGISSSGLLSEPKAPPWRVRLISNKIRPLIRGELAKITQEKPQPFVIPASSEDQDRIAAQAAEAIYNHIVEELYYNKILRQACFWALICGSAFLKDYWDESSTDSSGNPGKICLERISPFHIYVPDLAEEDIERQAFVIHASMKPLTTVKAMYGKNAKNLKVESTAKDQAETKYRSAMGLRDQNASNNDVLVKEIWIKPNHEHPKGLFAVWANDTFLVEPTEWPYEYKDYPFTKIDHIPTGRFYGDSTIVDLIPLQKEYNKTRSQIIESKNRMARPQLIAPRGSIKSSKITSEPGLIIEYQPGFDPPQPLVMQNLPSYVIQEQDRIQKDMDDISAQHEVSKGQAPPGVEAATAISFLQEQDDAKFSHTVDSIEAATAKVGRHFLYLVKQFWAAPRQVKVMGSSGFIEAQALRGADLGNNVDLRVQAGSAAPRSRAAKQAFLMELGKLGWVDPNLLLKHLEMGETEKLHEEIQIDMRHAQRENVRMRMISEQWQQQAMMTGMQMPPPQMPVNTWDNHQMHIAEHNMFRKTEEFEMLPPEAKMMWEQHVNVHQQYLMQQQGMMGAPGAPIPQQMRERPGGPMQMPGSPGPNPGGM